MLEATNLWPKLLYQVTTIICTKLDGRKSESFFHDASRLPQIFNKYFANVVFIGCVLFGSFVQQWSEAKYTKEPNSTQSVGTLC